MARSGPKELAFFTLGGTEYAGSLLSHDFDAEIIVKSCKAFNARHDRLTETKRRLDFNAETKRRDGSGNCQKCKLVSAMGFGVGFDFLSRYTGATFDVKTNTQRADAGGDLFQSHQAIDTDFSGSFNLLCEQGEVDTILPLWLDAETGFQKTLTFTDGTGTLGLPIYINSYKESGSISDLVQVTVGFMGNGTPTGSGGASTLFAAALTGSADLTYVYDRTDQYIAGNALISTGKITVVRDDITKESYQFLGLGDPSFEEA